MAKLTEVLIPDIGNATDVDVIEVMVSAGDSISKDDSLITLEGDKATMDVPSPFEGKVVEVKVNVGDKVSEGTLILTMEAVGAAEEKPATPKSSGPVKKDVVIPDIGNATDVDVIEVMVNAGDNVSKDDSLITLEGDKATMDVPSPYSGKVLEMKVKVGDKVSEGSLILTIETSDSDSAPAPQQAAAPTVAAPAPAAAPAAKPARGDVYAGPAVRRLAREFDIDLSKIAATGRKGRITKDDLRNYVKQAMQGGGLGVAPLPEIDFSQYGDIEKQPLNKIKKLTAKNLHRNWVVVPHVTQFDEADITDLEAYRKKNKGKAEEKGFKLTPLVFIMKAVVDALKAFPQFNSSLSADGSELILKKYYHIGVAADTPNGLVVPVIRDVDQKDIYQLAEELATISKKAREKGLSVKEMEGSTFTISSLGGIGGTAFTPIVNMPDVAILGVARSQMKPVYQNNEFVPRLMLPLSLSYDHRVIDGAEGARFSRHLASVLENITTVIASA